MRCTREKTSQREFITNFCSPTTLVIFDRRKADVQLANDPLDDAEVVHHLHKRDEEDDRSKGVDEEPVLGDGLRVEEELRGGCRLAEEVRCQGGNPGEQLEASVGFQDEQSDGLLQEQTNDDSWPSYLRAVLGNYPEEDLENKKAKDRNSTIAIRGALPCKVQISLINSALWG